MIDEPARLMIVGLPRPEYVAAPEALLASLAWDVYDVEGMESQGSRPIALAFRTEVRESKTLVFKATEPSDAEMESWTEALFDAGLYSANRDVVGRAVALSLRGVRAKNAKSQAATPLTYRLALLQNTRGMAAKRQPWDIAQMIESMFAIGSSEGGVNASAAELWLAAVDRRLNDDHILRAVDRASGHLLPGLVAKREVPRRNLVGSSPPAAFAVGTPFAWFNESWRRLTSDEWVDALPARVWVDWATTLLRTALGFGYLWEAKWYERLGRMIASDSVPQDVTWRSLVDDVGETLPWVAQAESISIRDIAPLLSARVRRGGAIRESLASWLDDHPKHAKGDIQECLKKMSADEDLCDSLERDLAHPPPRSNTWEAVRYALATRSSSGPYADHYGLVRTSGRYAVVAPGTEWSALIASLAAGRPKSRTTVGTVSESLFQLGLRPDVAELVGLLEVSGLARGSADADQAVEVQSAF